MVQDIGSAKNQCKKLRELNSEYAKTLFSLLHKKDFVKIEINKFLEIKIMSELQLNSN